jgi:UDP-2,3-diacylglucosamine hydrolase
MITVECKNPMIFFMSDAHLGQVPGEDETRVRALVSFFATVTAHHSSLFILGDFFDFWFEYRSVIPRSHFRILTALKGLTYSGTEVIYIGGNHDYWLGPFLEEEIGLRTYTEPVDLRAQGRRVFLAHGDGLGRRDWPYRALRGALHSRPLISLYKLLHPDLGLALAGWISRRSRSHSDGWAPNPEKLWNEVARPRFESGFDAVVLGHIHQPTELSRENRELYVLGDWINRCSFLVLQNGAFRRECWRREGAQDPSAERPK